MGLFRRKVVDDPIAPVMSRLAELEQRLQAERAEKAAMAERLAMLERRVAADREQVQERLGEVGTTMANQLGELGGELDATAKRVRELAAASASVSEQVADLEALHGHRLGDLEALAGKLDPETLASMEHLEVLRASQVALANELVRYEMALRQDLAVAVERLGPRPHR